MSDKKKFLFDLNYFDEHNVLHQKEDPNAPPPEPTFSEAELEAAKAEAFAAGKKEGIDQTKKEIEQQTQHTLQSVAQEMSGLFSCEQDRNIRFAEICATLCYQAIKKSFPAFYDRIGAHQLDHVLQEHLTQLKKEPALDITLHPDLANAVEGRLQELKERLASQGEWTILEDEKLDKAGCQITWNHGGLDWHPEQIMAAVLQTFEPHIRALSDELDVSDKTLHNEGSKQTDAEKPIAVSKTDAQEIDVSDPDGPQIQESEES